MYSTHTIQCQLRVQTIFTYSTREQREYAPVEIGHFATARCESNLFNRSLMDSIKIYEHASDLFSVESYSALQSDKCLYVL